MGDILGNILQGRYLAVIYHQTESFNIPILSKCLPRMYPLIQSVMSHNHPSSDKEFLYTDTLKRSPHRILSIQNAISYSYPLRVFNILTLSKTYSIVIY